ncbi:hypothetical protein H4217_006622 [Coemansia sp. RSA 1939]|nr:hypothetical protein H4217_006622 [Coemansia sp. RSA 1939]KAJ2604218.1 hypothetical protein EV177_006481 [Coemansia sp. RSA 1804]
MGVFWPLTNFPNIARFVGLIGVAASFCIIVDREARYTLMRYLYTQLKRLDETSARDIEETQARGDLLLSLLTSSPAGSHDKHSRNLHSHLIEQSDDGYNDDDDDNESTHQQRLPFRVSSKTVSKEPLGFVANAARDARSFASDSTAFSRAASPLGLRSISASSEMDAVNRLGEALISRLQKLDDTTSGGARDGGSTVVGRMALPPTPPDTKTNTRELTTTIAATEQPSVAKDTRGNGDADGSNGCHVDAVARQPLDGQQQRQRQSGGDEVLMPLTAVDGPQTPQQEEEEEEETPVPKPKPKPKPAAESKRLAALPNPNAPAVRSTMRDGRPLAFDYPHQADRAPERAAVRRERSHVEIETTTDHDSYGFVSNPAALVAYGGSGSNTLVSTDPTQHGSLRAGTDSAAAGAGDHYLFVCVKCHRQSTNEVCEKICSDEDGVLRCKLRPRSNGLPVDDMEDLVLPMTPKMYTNGRRKTTGRMLYENLTALHSQHERMKTRTACHGTTAPHSSASRECPNAVRSRLRIVPVNCLSMCHLGNVVAVAGPGKFSYQFGAMHETDSEDMQAILQFAEDYIESAEGFTKNKTRPPRLSRNILARIPPPLPSFTSIAE